MQLRFVITDSAPRGEIATQRPKKSAQTGATVPAVALTFLHRRRRRHAPERARPVSESARSARNEGAISERRCTQIAPHVKRTIHRNGLVALPEDPSRGGLRQGRQRASFVEWLRVALMRLEVCGDHGAQVFVQPDHRAL